MQTYPLAQILKKRFIGKEDIIQPGSIDTLYNELQAFKKGKGISHEELAKKLKVSDLS